MNGLCAVRRDAVGGRGKACGEPMFAIDPVERAAFAEIEELRAAAEAVEPRFRAGQRPGEPREASEVERLGAGQREADDMPGLAIAAGIEPECAGS